MLNKTDKKAIEKTINIIQVELDRILNSYYIKKNRDFQFTDNTCDKIRLLVECRNRLQNYFINGLD